MPVSPRLMSFVIAWLAFTSIVRAQIGDGRAVPRQDYFLAFQSYNLGEYRDALKGFRSAANGGIKRDVLTGEDILDDPCGRFNITVPGTLSAEEYDVAVYDLVNFLEYVAEPMAEERKHIGRMVLLFLLLLLVFVVLLNREYWKGIH